MERKRQKSQRYLIIKIVLIILIILLVGLLGKVVSQVRELPNAAQQPIDTFFVLGGSIQREMYVAQLAKQYPNVRILISTGADDPCIFKLFERNESPMEQVWLEKCAKNTFGNFYYSQPLLTGWNSHHIKLITSKSHLPRAKWMGQIILGAHGIWVDVDLVQEKGVPGNRESWLKTGLDVTRSTFWALASQVVQPPCPHLIQLKNINLKQWCNQKFRCEYQSGISPKEICNSFSPQ